MSESDPSAFRLALVQMHCVPERERNIAAAKRAVARVAKRGADLCVLPELFTNRYVGQFNDAAAIRARLPDPVWLLEDFRDVARNLSTPLVVPYPETLDSDTCYNALAVIDADGTVLARYRKIHIPDEEGYREDLYFRPGDLGYVVAPVRGLRLGVAICWDQWFPEVARILALRGAQLIVYPSAIGSEVVAPDFDSRPDWELVMRAHAITNRVFVAALNRVGPEERIRFYGGSFVADPWGKVIKRASRTRPETIYADLDLSQIAKANTFFGFFGSRRPESYGELAKAKGPPTPVVPRTRP